MDRTLRYLPNQHVNNSQHLNYLCPAEINSVLLSIENEKYKCVYKRFINIKIARRTTGAKDSYL